MSAMNKETEQSLATLDRILGDDPARDVAKSIVNEVASLPEEQARYLSYRQLAHFGHVDLADGRLLQSIAVLTAGHINFLRPFYVFEASDGEEYRLTPADLSEAQQRGYLVDPHSGDEVHDYRNHILPYFECRFKK